MKLSTNPSDCKRPCPQLNLDYELHLPRQQQLEEMSPPMMDANDGWVTLDFYSSCDQDVLENGWYGNFDLDVISCDGDDDNDDDEDDDDGSWDISSTDSAGSISVFGSYADALVYGRPLKQDQAPSKETANHKQTTNKTSMDPNELLHDDFDANFIMEGVKQARGGKPQLQFQGNQRRIIDVPYRLRRDDCLLYHGGNRSAHNWLKNRHMNRRDRCTATAS